MCVRSVPTRRSKMNSQSVRRIALGFLTIGCMLVNSPADLHAQSTFGSIIGTIQDASGAAMPGVAVKIKNLNDNTTRSTLTDTSGEYQVLNLRPGSYEIVGSKENFSPATIPCAALDAPHQLRS